jgi:diaminopimelate decarboxylase
VTATIPLSPLFPHGAHADERGRLVVGGCDAVELARRFGTPAYVVDEDDLRARARAMLVAFRDRHADTEVVFAAKAFPAVAVLRVFAEEGLGADVAGPGELAVALAAGHAPERVHLHGNAKTEAELAFALEAGVGHVVLDNLDELAKLERVARGAGARRRPRVALRVTPDVAGDTHRAISTGQADSKFGFGLAELPRALARAREGFEVEGLHFHIGSQLLDLDPFRRAVAAVAPFMAGLRTINLGGGLGADYGTGAPPSFDAYAAGKVAAVHELLGTDVTILDEPGRALVANAGVTLYTVQSVKRNVRTWVAVDGGMSDNLRPMLYGARYEAHLADRVGAPGEPARVVGRHCESGDVLVEGATLADPRAGDVLVVPATGAYGHALANQYNGQLRPPVVFVSGGRARVVVRRDTEADLLARDV